MRRARIPSRLAPAVALAFCLAGCADRPELPPSRNLLLISLDTLRADALGSYGSERGASPFLDAWAARSVRFDRAWSHSPKTAPSHMSLFTGLPPRVHGVGNLESAGVRRLGDDVPTLAEILQQRGFATAGFSSGGNMKGSLGFDRGFERFEDESRPLMEKLAAAQRWLSRRPPDRRWFLFLHTYHVHDPYLPPPQVARRFTDPGYAGRIVGDRARLEALMESGDDLAPELEGYNRFVANYWNRVDSEDPADVRHLHDLYLASTAAMDAKLAGFFAWLEQSGHLEDTLVVITSDHGEEFGEHRSLRHGQLWREVLHVPLLVRLPGDHAGGLVLEDDVRHVDVAPSLLELLDVPDTAPLRLGESWAPWIAEPERAAPRPVYSEHRSHRDLSLDLWSLRADGWLLHQDRDGLKLHHLEQDFDELRPLEDDERRRALEDLQKRELGRLQALVDRFATGEGVELDAETRAELEALGYL